MNNTEALGRRLKGLWSTLGRYRYVLLVLAAGVLLLLLPSGGGGGGEQPAEIPEEDFSVESLERRLAETLSQVEGAGEVQVMLTVQSGMRRVLAQDSSMEQDGTAIQRETDTVVVSSGSGAQEAVLLQQIYPQFQGALVVCSGGDDPAVCLKLTQAVSALTGLGSDKISICKGK